MKLKRRREIRSIVLNLDASIRSAEVALQQIEDGQADRYQAASYLAVLLNAVTQANYRLKRIS